MKTKRTLIAVILSMAMLGTFFQVPFVEAEKTEEILLKNPSTDVEGVSTWDCIYFGNYWQSDTNGDGVADQNDEKEPIKWRILSVNGDDAFLLADQCLNSLSYHTSYDDVTWEHCTLRSWLNGYDIESNTANIIDYRKSNFIDAAFSPNEQASIRQTELNNKDNPELETQGGNDTIDKIYLLSVQDITNASYGFWDGTSGSDTRIASTTAYVEPECYEYFGGYWCNEVTMWRLRTPGAFQPLCVEPNGWIDDRGRDTLNFYGVRPALHLNISDTSLWSYAGQISASGARPILPTSEPIDTATPDITETPNPTTKPADTAKPDMTEIPNLTTEPDDTAKPDVIESPKPTSEPEDTVKPNITDSPNPTTEPADTAKPDITENPEPTADTNETDSPLEGTVLKDSKNKVLYKVLAQGKTVALYKVEDKKATKIVIPATVTINGIKYKVTAIADNAFNRCRKLKAVTIGKNISRIGRRAFYRCKKLKSITIKSRKLKSKSVGAQAFKSIHKKAVIKVPKKQRKAYRKWLKKKGITKKVKIK